MKPGLVGGEERAVNGHAAKGPDTHPAIRVAAPRTAPVLQLNQLVRALL